MAEKTKYVKEKTGLRSNCKPRHDLGMGSESFVRVHIPKQFLPWLRAIRFGTWREDTDEGRQKREHGTLQFRSLSRRASVIERVIVYPKERRGGKGGDVGEGIPFNEWNSEF